MKHPYITPQITIRSPFARLDDKIKERINEHGFFNRQVGNIDPFSDEFKEKVLNPLFMHDPMNYLGDEATRKIYEAMQKQTDQLNRQFETICHNYLDPPIKGEITKGKLLWRGVKGIVQQRQATPNGFSLIFLGIIQRDTLITPTGVKVPYKPNAQDTTQTL